ncbi:MAG TPA: trypsin-like peptidase domain-containing protein [Lacunisphaera sp.]|nr:trypsin-like peptidase domain-containing protein [Lacunisphaera sp.]
MRFCSHPLPRRILISLFLAVAAAHAAAAEDAQAPAASTPPPAVAPGVENSVVKIFSTARFPDPFRPWQKQSPRDGSGTGVVIEGKRILTNAHVVLYASQVQVQAHQSGDRLPATVEFISPGIDLAVLKLEDESFFDTHAPLPRATQLPSIKDNVMAYGYPTGGTSLSITKGIVSRIDFAPYNYPVSGLRIQIDAAINPGNSGGPALSGDVMIGLAFSRLGGADNIGYIIPNEEIELFLKDIADGHVDGKPALFDELQSLENPALRALLQADKSLEGIVVSRPASATANHPLREWDIITRIGDTPVDNEGMIKLGDNLRVRFTYLIQRIARNGMVPLTLVRKGQEMKLELPVEADRPMLIPDLNGAYPPYFVYGPLVFSVATGQFLGPIATNSRAMTSLTVIGSPLATRRGDAPAFDGEELVLVASPFFPHRLAKGYDSPQSRVVDTVNDIKIKNLRHLVEVLRDSTDKFITIEFVGRGAESIVFDRLEMIAATEDILNDNGVRAQGSPDMMEIWQAKTATPPAKAAVSPAKAEPAPPAKPAKK